MAPKQHTAEFTHLWLTNTLLRLFTHASLLPHRVWFCGTPGVTMPGSALSSLGFYQLKFGLSIHFVQIRVLGLLCMVNRFSCCRWLPRELLAARQNSHRQLAVPQSIVTAALNVFCYVSRACGMARSPGGWTRAAAVALQQRLFLLSQHVPQQMSCLRVCTV
jgi:hypothetical protein